MNLETSMPRRAIASLVPVLAVALLGVALYGLVVLAERLLVPPR